jgi:NitT/TauT family transport system substrate-binding protein
MRRRELLRGAVAAGAAAMLAGRSRAADAEPPPETTRLTLLQTASMCQAPQYVAEDLLRGEGFSDVRYIKKDGPRAIADALASGEANINMHFSGPLILRLDAGAPITILAGVHPGCYELFATERVRTLSDLKGKTVGIRGLEGPEHIFLSSMLAYVGLDPRKDVTWVTHSTDTSIALLAENKIDAFMGFPPDPQEIRARKIGHVVVNSNLDRPWSQYFCCVAAANREFVQRYPIATKRALRAILKGADVCASEPDRASRYLVDSGRTPRYDLVRQALKEIPYGRWRDYDPEDTVRFYALRLREAGMIRSTPQKIIAVGTDWRVLTELKKELKG